MDDTDQRKLFVGGICWETTADILREHFSKYGTVIACAVGKDRYTGSPRGFAFVSFSDPSAVHQALLHTHIIRGREVDVKRARPRTEQSEYQQQQNRGSDRNNNNNGNSKNSFRTKKIFVGGLPSDLTDLEFRTYFEKFGRITDVVVMHDNVTHRPRGFGFITFDNEESVDSVMHTNFHELGGKLVEVKKAVPKDGNSPNSNAGQNGNIGGTHSYHDPRYGVLYPGYAYHGLGGYLYPPVFPGGVYGRYGYAPGFGPWTAGPPMAGFGFGGDPIPYSNVYWNSGVGVTNAASNGDHGFNRPGSNGKSSHLGGGGDLQVDDAMVAAKV